MSRFEQAAWAVGVSGAIILSGCGEAAPSPQDLENAASVTREYGPQLEQPTTEGMDVEYTVLPDASPAVAGLQRTIGDAAVASILTKPVEARIDDKPTTITMSVPQEADARKQFVVITANSANAPWILKELKKDTPGDRGVSVTKYGLNEDGPGQFKRSGAAVSVVGQEMDGVGAIQNIATERCQPLDLHASTPVDAKTYAALKEAVCNSLGVAADRALLGQSYEEYAANLKGTPLGGDVNGSGHVVTYPLVSADQYGQLYRK